jgi:hypothetical protein
MGPAEMVQVAWTVAETANVVLTVVDAEAEGVIRPSVRIATAAGTTNFTALESFIFITPRFSGVEN